MFFEVNEQEAELKAFQGNEKINTGSIKEIKKYLEEIAHEGLSDGYCGPEEFNFFVSKEKVLVPDNMNDPIVQKTIQFYLDRENLLLKKLSEKGIDELTENDIKRIIDEVNSLYNQEKLDEIIEKFKGVVAVLGKKSSGTSASVDRYRSGVIKRAGAGAGAGLADKSAGTRTGYSSSTRVKEISLKEFEGQSKIEKKKATSYQQKNNIKVDVSKVVETITNYSNFAKSYIVIFNRFSMIDSIIKYFHENKDESDVISSLNDMLRRYYAHENIIMQKLAQSGLDMGILHLVCVIVSMINSSENFSENIELVHNLLLFDK